MNLILRLAVWWAMRPLWHRTAIIIGAAYVAVLAAGAVIHFNR